MKLISSSVLIILLSTDKFLGFGALYTILLEDHTLGNMLKMMLLRNPKIRFAAYRKPHPLENKIEIKIQTNGEITANEAFKEALSNLTQDLNHCQRSFLDQLRNFDSNK